MPKPDLGLLFTASAQDQEHIEGVGDQKGHKGSDEQYATCFQGGF